MRNEKYKHSNFKFINLNVTMQGIGTTKLILAFISLCDKVRVFDGRINYLAVAVTMVK
jgi:hypothetical protein